MLELFIEAFEALWDRISEFVEEYSRVDQTEVVAEECSDKDMVVVLDEELFELA